MREMNFIEDMQSKQLKELEDRTEKYTKKAAQIAVLYANEKETPADMEKKIANLEKEIKLKNKKKIKVRSQLDEQKTKDKFLTDQLQAKGNHIFSNQSLNFCKPDKVMLVDKFKK